MKYKTIEKIFKIKAICGWVIVGFGICWAVYSAFTANLESLVMASLLTTTGFIMMDVGTCSGCLGG